MMFVFVGFSPLAGECERSIIAEPMRREGWRIEGFLVASPEACLCWAGIVIPKSVCRVWKEQWRMLDAGNYRLVYHGGVDPEPQ